jgi:hypothetical protein
VSAGIEVDGPRPAVEWVTSLPREWRVNDAERLLLMVLACDAFDVESAPGYENLAAWTGLQRSSVVGLVARLCLPSEWRPALIERSETTRGGRRTAYRLLIHNRSTGPTGPDDENRSAYRSGNRSAYRSTSPTGNRSVPPATPYSPSPSPDRGGWPVHKNEVNARRAISTIIRDNRLPISVEDVLTHAYRVGGGNPWDGYKILRPGLEASLNGARDRAGVLRSRLERTMA